MLYSTTKKEVENMKQIRIKLYDNSYITAPINTKGEAITVVTQENGTVNAYPLDDYDGDIYNIFYIVRDFNTLKGFDLPIIVEDIEPFNTELVI